MKLCPQCDFIYEDDQTTCDMDGKELVSQPVPVVGVQGFAAPPSVPANAVPDVPSMPMTTERWSSLTVATAVGVVLAALVLVVYLARTYQTKSPQRGPSASSAERSSASTGDGNGQPTSGANSTQTPSETSSPDHAQVSAETAPAQPDQTNVDSPQAAVAKEALAHTRLTPGPVTAGAPSGNSRGPVIVRLTNGAAIRADEAWEKREGIWYRQGGVVTFLKRSQVRTIERLPPPTQRSKAATSNAGEKSRQTQSAPEPKKESKVSSFFKKTTRILKKPFKF